MNPRAVRFLRAGALFLAAAWCGGMAFFAFWGAGIVLRTSPSRHAAGGVNRALLDALDIVSLAAALVLLVFFVLLSRGDAGARRRAPLVVRLTLVAAAAAAASCWVITPRMWELRLRMPVVIDLVPQTDPLRRAWGRLHGVSTLALLVRVAASAGTFVLLLPTDPPDS